MAELATGLVGAMTQAFQASAAAAAAVQRENDGGGGGELRRLAARQSTATSRLPVFAGDAEDWPGFSAIYHSSTAECGFSDAENTQRLQSCLKGVAKEAVKHMLTVPDNVSEVMKTLERRFGRPELVVGQLVSKVRGFRAVRADDIEALLSFANTVQNVVTTMKLLKSEGHMTNPTLRTELVDKLPIGLRLQWGEHLKATWSDKGEALPLERFADWLTERSEAAALVAPAKAGARGGQFNPPASQAARTIVATQPRSDSKKCPKCSGNHNLGQCHSFKSLSVKLRWRFIKSQNQLCAQCLERGHWAKACSRKLCSACQGRHHTLLHFNEADPNKKTEAPQQSLKSSSATSSVKQDSERTLTSQTMDSPPAVSTETHCALSPATDAEFTSFMLAPVVLTNGSQRVQGTALLDPASSTSYIRQSMAAAVNLHGQVEQLTTTVLGGKHVTGRREQVTVAVESMDGTTSAKFAAWVLPVITKTIVHEDWNARKLQWPHLRHIDFPQVGQHIDILIGLNAAGLHAAIEEC